MGDEEFEDPANRQPINLDDLRISAVEVATIDARTCYKELLDEKYGRELVEKTIELAKEYDVYLEDQKIIDALLADRTSTAVSLKKS